jgi:hypothetical protein
VCAEGPEKGRLKFRGSTPIIELASQPNTSRFSLSSIPVPNHNYLIFIKNRDDDPGAAY